MRHVRADKVSSGQRAEQRQLASHDGGGDEPCESLGVLAGVGGVRAPHAEHLEDALLGSENGSATDGANLDTRHADSHQ